MITVGAADAKLSILWANCDAGAREAGKDPTTMPHLLQLHVSWARTDEEAMSNAMVEWPNGGMPFPKQDLRNPEDFASIAKLVKPENFTNRMLITSDIQKQIDNIQHSNHLGFDENHLHTVGRDQSEFIEVFGKEVLPHLKPAPETATPASAAPA
jgi:coenzyme F420-dependent glucose-6-phosphate dehydrogenase